MVRRAPAELFGHFESERLRTFRVVGPDVDVDEGPVVRTGEFGAEAIHGVIVAAHLHQRGAVDAGAHDLALLEVMGDEDDGLHASGGGVSADAVRQVAGAGAGELFVAEFTRPCRGHGDHTVLEGPRRVRGVILDVEVVQAERLAEVFRAHERRVAGADIDRRIGVAGQEILVAPEAGGATLDRLAGDVLTDAVVVVGHFDGTETELADVEGRERVFAMTLATAQVSGETHALLSVCRNRRRCQGGLPWKHFPGMTWWIRGAPSMRG